jgi:hypothetical protein
VRVVYFEGSSPTPFIASDTKQNNVWLHIKSYTINHQAALNCQKQISIVDSVHINWNCGLIYINIGSVEGLFEETVAKDSGCLVWSLGILKNELNWIETVYLAVQRVYNDWEVLRPFL